MRISAIAVLTAAVGLPSFLLAQETAPSTKTAQITYSIGKVSVQPGGKGEWIKASPGLTLAVGDNLWADQNSEVEIYAGTTAVMVAPETSAAFDQLDNSEIKLNLRLGSVIVQMPAVDEGKHWEIGTPNLRFSLSESGDYRLDVNAEGDETAVTAKKGHGQAIVDGAAYVVAAGQQIRFKTKDHLEIEAGAIPDPDSFDLWASGSNQPEHHEDVAADDIRADSAVTEAASRRVWESNGDAGHWVFTEDLGPVWVPTHWSELIILPPQPVGVVLVQPVSTQEMSLSSSGQHAVLWGVPKPVVNLSAAGKVLVMPSASSTNNGPWMPAVQRNSDSSSVHSLATIHQAQAPAYSPQVFFPHKMEQLKIPTPKPPTPPTNKSKK